MTCSRKWWYTKFMCLVRARILGMFAISIAPLLSSNAVHTILGVVLTTLKPFDLNSVSRFMIGITSRRDCDRATYSASVVDKLIWVWRREAQIIGQPAKSMIKPVRDFAVLTSCSAVEIFQFPLKSASTYTSSNRSEFTFRRMPCVHVARKYEHRWRRASKCSRFGSSEKYASWWTA